MDPSQQPGLYPNATPTPYPYPPQVQGQPVYVQPTGPLAAPIGMSYNDQRMHAGMIRRVHNDHSIHMQCPNCGDEGHTKVHHYNGVGSWGLCLVLFGIGCTLCAPIPLCCEPCQDADHECHKCGKTIATKRVVC